MEFPVIFFSFPLNLLLFMVWAVAVLVVWKKRPESRFVRFMLSPGATHWAIGLFLVFCLATGLTGWRWLVSTWPFVLFLLYFQTVLAFVILRGWRSPAGSVRWRFLFLHVGLLAALASAFWGAPDSETLRVKVFKDMPVSEAFTEDAQIRWLDYSLTLEDFSVTYGDDGMPSDYRAWVSVGDSKTELRVNHPYSVRFGEDLYLSGYDTYAGEYCVLQIVREPWRYGAFVGIVLMLAGAFMLFIGGPRRKNNEND